jgi:iron complex outermembrane receptor protein
MRRVLVLLCACAIVSAVAVSAPRGAWAQEASKDEPAAQAPARSPGRTVEEIIVTSQRREQSIQEVPISITAFSAETIETYRITNAIDLNYAVPNLTVQPGAGGTRAATYQMRGLKALGSALGSDAGIATYIDGVYLRGGSGGVSNYAALERIEVLRGPQGTLFGRNTTGGAVHFITPNPKGEFGLKQTFSAGNHHFLQSKTHIDSPQWGPISASLSYVFSDKEGDVRNKGEGFFLDFRPLNGSTFTSPERLGDERTNAVFLAVRFDFIDELDLVYKFDFMDLEGTQPATGILAWDTATLPGFLASFIRPSLSGDSRPGSVNNALHSGFEHASSGHNLTAEYRISDAWSLRNILSFRTMKVQVPGNQLDGLGAIAPTVLVFATSSEASNRQLSEEIQSIYDSELFALTTGFLYYHVDESSGPYANARNGVFGGTPASTFPGTIRTQKSDAEVDSYAFYGQTEVHLTSQLDLVLGGRFTKDEKEYVDRTLFTGTVLTPSFKKDKWTYLVGINYMPTDDLLLYAKLSTGYISGGTVSTLAYDPEEAKSYEVGAKATWMDGTIQTNIALFHVDYDNQQFATSGGLVVPPVPSSQVLVNAGDSRARGLELETLWLPTNNIRLGLNLGYLDFDFKGINTTLLGGDITLPNAPEWSGTAMVEYETNPLFREVTLVTHLDVSYRSKEFSVTRELAYQAGQGENDPTFRANAQLSLRGLELAGSDLTVTLWGRNLFDSDKPSSIMTMGPISAGYYEPERSYGIDLTFEF